MLCIFVGWSEDIAQRGGGEEMGGAVIKSRITTMIQRKGEEERKGRIVVRKEGRKGRMLCVSEL